MVLQPMRRPARSEYVLFRTHSSYTYRISCGPTEVVVSLSRSANPIGLRIMPAKEADILALAHMHNASFADDAFMRLIWGRTDSGDFDRALAKDFSRRRAHVQKGIAPGVRDPVGMTLAYIVDTVAERGKENAKVEEEEHLPGTDVGLLKEFMAMLDRVRAAYREGDSRFYREYQLTTALPNLRDKPAKLPAKHCRYGDIADLEILAVHPDFQRKRFGQALLESVLVAADRDNLPVYLEASASMSLRRRDCLPVVRRSHTDERRRAVGAGLYRKHGFVECAARASCGPDGVISASRSEEEGAMSSLRQS